MLRTCIKEGKLTLGQRAHDGPLLFSIPEIGQSGHLTKSVIPESPEAAWMRDFDVEIQFATGSWVQIRSRRPLSDGPETPLLGKTIPGAAAGTVQDEVPLIHECLEMVLNGVTACIGDPCSLRDSDPAVLARQLEQCYG